MGIVEEIYRIAKDRNWSLRVFFRGRARDESPDGQPFARSEEPDTLETWTGRLVESERKDLDAGTYGRDGTPTPPQTGRGLNIDG